MLFIYIYVHIYTHTHTPMCVHDRSWLAWPCQSLTPTGLAEACHEANEALNQPSGDPS